MPEPGESVTGHSGARGILAAADKIEGRIVEAEKMRTALEEIKRLHAPRGVCEGCGDTYRPHDRDCIDGGPLLSVCSVCCFDGHGWGDECQGAHDHVGDTADGPACSTAEIIARCGL